jgi:signal peptide peptidase SppA
MSTKEERCWAGSEASYETAMEAEIKIAAGGFDKEDECESPRLLAVSDGLATITIKGPLVNSDSPYLKYFGVTGYPEIRDAVLAAVSDPEVKQILLDVDSGGGAVSGCADTGALIRAAHKVKPITTYGETMASAAYWLGCSAGRVYSGKAALVGSIGVKATFKEYSKANEMAGVTVTVIRAGKYKALADSNEPLTKAGEAQIQAMADASYGVFVDHVAEMRGRTYEYTDKTMADGQEFIGQAAVDVGLTDGITTFDAVVGGLKKKILASLSKPMDNTGTNRFKLSGDLAPTTPEDSTMAKKALTEADIAALAAGAAIEAVVEAVIEQADTTETVTAEVPNGVQEEAATEEVVEKVATSDPTVQYLQSQIKDKDSELLQAGIKLAKVEEQLAELKATVDPLLSIAVKSVTNMAVALKSAPVATLSTPAAQVLAEHARLSDLFQKQFPIGGVAAVSASNEPKKSAAYVMTNVTQAQLNAVRGSK